MLCRAVWSLADAKQRNGICLEQGLHKSCLKEGTPLGQGMETQVTFGSCSSGVICPLFLLCLFLLFCLFEAESHHVGLAGQELAI